MRSFLGWIGLLLLASLIGLGACAAGADVSDQDLLEKSDLVALVRVLNVTCTSLTKDAATGEELPSYLATLQVLEVKKGDAKRGDEVIVTWRAVPKSIVGPWTVYYYPGEEVVTHLAKRSGGASYASTWWNAKGDDVKAPDTRDLPVTPGESVEATPEKQKQTPL
jgi:hypothetical protein